MPSYTFCDKKQQHCSQEDGQLNYSLLGEGTEKQSSKVQGAQYIRITGQLAKMVQRGGISIGEYDKFSWATAAVRKSSQFVRMDAAAQCSLCFTYRDYCHTSAVHCTSLAGC